MHEPRLVISSTRGRVLVVDDDEHLRPSLVEILSSAGFAVGEAANGHQALQILRRDPMPDVILLDLMMPVMNGWEFRAQQKLDPLLADTPVIVLTANDSAQASAIDARRVLRKPLPLAKLVDALQSVVDERRRSQEKAEEERLASLVTMADGVANRINVPASSLVTALRRLQELHPQLNGDPRVREGARQAVLDGLIHADGIRRVVHDLWAFSRIEDSTRTLVDIPAVLESCIALVVCRTRSLVNIVPTHQETPPIIANQARLSTLFSNILTNAVEAACSQVLTRSFTRDQRLVVEIEDDGAGMSPKMLGRVFEPFFSTKPASEGSGLGLSIALGIAHSLGGEIEVDSVIGQGSTFRVLLPTAGSMFRSRD